MLNVVTTAIPEAHDGAGVRNVQKGDTGGHHTVESGRGAKIEQSENTNEEAAGVVGVQGHIESVVDLRKPLVSRHTTVTSKSPAEARLPSVARNQTSHSGDEQQCLQHDGTGHIVKRLVVKLQDGHTSGCVQELVQIIQTEEHGDTVEPSGDKANANRGHNGDGDVFLRLWYLLRKVGRRVQTGKDPVWVDQPNNKSHTVRLPSSGIDEMTKHICSTSMSLGTGGHRNQNHEEG